MSDETDVDLFIPVRNGERYIGECIESILGQSFPHWRLRVLDNRSTDRTRDVVERYAATDARITIQTNDRDLGAIGNFNRALDLVEANLYGILSHDDLYRSPSALADAHAALDRYPDVAAVYSNVEWVDARARRIAVKRMPLRGKADTHEVARRSILAGRNHFGVPVLLRASCARDLRFDPSFPLTGDIDFSAACALHGSSYFMETPAVGIRFHGSNGTMRAYGDLEEEFRRLSEKHGVPLGSTGRLRLALASKINNLKKRAFFFYLDHVRDRGAT